MNEKPAYKRVLLKLSGEILQGDRGYGISPVVLDRLSNEIKEVVGMGVQIALVIGGGNIFRGLEGSAIGIERAQGDYMGMLATVINSLALQNALEQKNVYTRVQSAIGMQQIAEPYIRRRAIRHLEKGRVVIFAAGTGNTYFTTDTAAVLRASEIGAEVILKGTKVDGVYDADPMRVSGAKKIVQVNYLEVLQRSLKVMDATAISHCMDNHLPIVVFNIRESGNLRRIILGEPIGTVVKDESKFVDR